MKKSCIRLTVCVYIIICLIFGFNTLKTNIEKTVNIWISIIVPSVFPYIVLSKYLCKSDALKIAEVFPGKLIAKIFKLSACSVRAVICSLFCGYPSGAICAWELYENKEISRNEAKRLILFTNNAGPLYIISAIGIGLMGSVKTGVGIYCIHITSALLYGYINSLGKPKPKLSVKKAIYYSPDLCLCIKQGVETTVNICGYMIAACVFSVCTKMLIHRLAAVDCLYEYVNIFTDGFFEISAGISTTAKSELCRLKIPVICAISSWSGLSVIMQIKSVSGNIINTFDIIKAKLCQSVISFFMGFVFDYAVSEKYGISYNADNVFKFSIVLSAILFIYYLINKKTVQKLN